MITDGEPLLFSDGGNHIIVPESDHTDGRRWMTALNERLIHVDVDDGNKKRTRQILHGWCSIVNILEWSILK